MHSGATIRSQVLSLVPGRIRVHLPAWSGKSPGYVEDYLLRVDGVQNAQANALTGNILLHFDPRLLSTDLLLAILSVLQAELRVTALPRSEANLDSEPCSASPPMPMTDLGTPLVRGVAQGAIGHAVMDGFFFGATASAYAVGWTWVGPLAVLHLLLDMIVWGLALQPITQEIRRRQAKRSVVPLRAA